MKTAEEFYKKGKYKHLLIDYNTSMDAFVNEHEVVTMLRDYHKSKVDGWIKYDPKDENTWPNEKYQIYDVWFEGGTEALTSIFLETKFKDKEVTHYQERPSKPLDK